MAGRGYEALDAANVVAGEGVEKGFDLMIPKEKKNQDLSGAKVVQIYRRGESEQHQPKNK